MKFLLILLQSLNILIFGHSYGVDCTEYLPSLAVESGITTLRIGRFIKGNCSMEEHFNYFQNDTINKYSECAPGTTVFKTRRKSVRDMAKSVCWDYVIFQNSLENEGRYETAQPYLNELVEYIRTTQKEKFGKEPIFGWNMFWPISRLREDGSHKLCSYRLSFYENSSAKMWEAYMKATRELTADTGIDFIIPSGTAVMNFRASKYNTPEAKELTRDGYHMSYGGGRYLAACTFFEKILRPIYKKSVLGNSFRVDRKPVPVTDDATAKMLQTCAVKAVKQPFKISKIK